MPPQSMLLKVINVTSVDLDLNTWITSGCPIRFFSVQYKVWGDTAWTEVSNNIQSNKVGKNYKYVQKDKLKIHILYSGLTRLSWGNAY